jgi:hypothetical protein
MPKDPTKPKKEKRPVVKHVAKALNNGALARKILGSNPYLALVLDPWNSPPAFIPDDNMADTALFTVVKRLDVTVINGVMAVRLGGYAMENSTLGAPAFAYGIVPTRNSYTPAALKWIVGQTSSGSSGPNQLFVSITATGAPPGQAIYFENAFGTDTTDSAVPSYFTHVRLISAGMQAQYTGTALDSKGLLVAAFVPKSGEASAILPDPENITFDQLMKIKDSAVCAVNTLKGIQAKYKPSDPMCFKFLNMGLTYNHQDSEEVDTTLQQGELFIAANGCTDGATFHIDIICHYEGLVASNQFQLVDSHKTVNSPSQMATAQNVTAMSHATKPVSFTAQQQNAPTNFGSIAQAPLNSLQSGTGLLGSMLPDFGNLLGGSDSSSSSSSSKKSKKGKSTKSTISDMKDLAEELGPLLEMA